MPSAVGATPIEAELERHRRALTGYCYRMLGSSAEAEDAVQETFLRAWRAADKLQEHAALKSWLYRIASNVCFDALDAGKRRATPMDLGPSSDAGAELGAPLPETAWVQPIADGKVLPADDPAAVADQRETLRLAFVAALQHLPPRQRAVLVLCEVLRWKAAEAAELLDTSVASVNSALQRARATLEKLDLGAADGAAAIEGEREQALLAQYVAAFEAYDIAQLVTLLKDDAQFTMPPFPLWVQGPAQVQDFMLGTGAKCRGSKLLTLRLNGSPAVAIYNPAAPGRWEPWAVVALELSGGRIAALHHFIFPGLFEELGLPPVLAGEDGVEAGQLQQPA